MKKELSNKLQLLLRSEKALLKLEMRKKGRQVVLATIGIVAVLATLVMLNVTGYLYLATHYEPLQAAFMLTGIDFVIAIVFFILAVRQEVGAEADAINEIRDYAMKELSDDLNEFKEEANEIRESFSKVSSGISSVFNRDFSAVKAVIPLVELFVQTRKKKSK